MKKSEIILQIQQGDGEGISGKAEVKAFTFTFPNLDNVKKEETENETGSTEE